MVQPDEIPLHVRQCPQCHAPPNALILRVDLRGSCMIRMDNARTRHMERRALDRPVT
jgi:hypothetical protein